MLLIDDLLKGLFVDVPFEISREVLREIKCQVDEERGHYSDPGEVRDEVRKLQVSLETGEISREEYDQREEELLTVLEELRTSRGSNQKTQP
ncbi:MAG: gas vesicle protein GvpG [Candidatus Bipolaricaulota bacterium]